MKDKFDKFFIEGLEIKNIFFYTQGGSFIGTYPDIVNSPVFFTWRLPVRATFATEVNRFTDDKIINNLNFANGFEKRYGRGYILKPSDESDWIWNVLATILIL